MKHHPYFQRLLSGDSSRIAYGARTLNEGGLQSVPKLHFPGGALIGCSAGFVNVAKIKGTHNAMKSGMLAAEAAFDAIGNATTEEPTDMSQYEENLKKSWVWSDLYEVRNLRPSFTTSLGIWGGIAYSGLDSLFFKGRTPWTFRNTCGASDAHHTKRASECKPIEYPPYQPPLSTDLLTSLALTGTNHAEDQPVHLRVRQYAKQNTAGTEGERPSLEEEEKYTEGNAVRREHVRRNVGEYAGLLGRACPAQVYEYVEDHATQGEDGEGWGGKRLVINSQVRYTTVNHSILCDDGCFPCRTVFTASCAILKFQRKISPGLFPKEVEDLSTVRSLTPASVLASGLTFPDSYYLIFVSIFASFRHAIRQSSDSKYDIFHLQIPTECLNVRSLRRGFAPSVLCRSSWPSLLFPLG